MGLGMAHEVLLWSSGAVKIKVLSYFLAGDLGLRAMIHFQLLLVFV
jgi:hypothetical protein